MAIKTSVSKKLLRTPRSESRVEQAALARIVGERFREARELNNMTQIVAAEKLGFANSAKLAKIENGTDTNTVHFYTIWKASHLYNVSTDFLNGISDDWERSPVVAQERHIGKWLHDQTMKAVSREINMARQLANRLTAVERAVEFGLSSVSALKSVIDDFAAKNEQFDDMRLGAKLLRVAAETSEQMLGISAELKRYHAFHETREPVNMDVFRDLGD